MFRGLRNTTTTLLRGSGPEGGQIRRELLKLGVIVAALAFTAVARKPQSL